MGWVCKAWFHDDFFSLKYGVPENVHVRSLEILRGGGLSIAKFFEGNFDVRTRIFVGV